MPQWALGGDESDILSPHTSDDDAESVSSAASDDMDCRLATIISVKTKLYESADVTVFESYLLAFQYAIRHRLTKTAFTELLQLIAVHLPSSTQYPKSVSTVKGFSLELFPYANPIMHKFCTYCLSTTVGDCDLCSTPDCQGDELGQFISVPLAPQLKNMMESKYVSESTVVLSM